jgi:hypothetical protein
MKSETALNARGWAFQDFQSGVAPKGRCAFPVNPPRRSVDFNHAPFPVTPVQCTNSDGYLVAIHYPSSSNWIPEGYQ